MEFDTQVANAIQKFVDSKYAIDNPMEGYDCLNSLRGFFEGMGVKMPIEFEDWTLENYGKRALKDPQKAHKAFERFVQTLGHEIDKNYLLRGDLILFKVKDIGTYAGIYLGNQNVFMMFDKGGRVSPLQPFRPYIKQVRRLL